MKSYKDIELILQENRVYLFSKYYLKSLAIFGSMAREEQNDNGDLDILVDFNGQIGIQFIDLADELEKLTGLRVDLVSRNGIEAKYYHSVSQDLKYV